MTPRRLRLAVGFVVLALGACGGSDAAKLDVDRIETGITDQAVARFDGATVDDAVCPDDATADVGESFRCTITVDGQDLPIVVEHVETDEGTSYQFALDSSLTEVELRDYADAAAAFVLQNEGVDVAASCGDEGKTRVFIGKVTKIACRVDYGDVDRGVEVVTKRNGTVKNVKFTEAKLDVGLVSDRVVQQLIGELDGGFFLSCPDTFPDETVSAVLAPDATFRCTAVRDFVEIATIEVTVRNAAGNVDAKVV